MSSALASCGELPSLKISFLYSNDASCSNIDAVILSATGIPQNVPHPCILLEDRPFPK